MSLISNANLKSASDKLAWAHDIIIANIGSVAAGVVVGTSQWLVNAALSVALNSADFQQESDLNNPLYQSFLLANAEAASPAALKQAIAGLVSHCSNRGASVSATIADLISYLNYYNGGAGGAAYNCLLHPRFGDLYFAVQGARLPAAGLMQPAIHPFFTAAWVNGMGLRAVGGAFTAGQAYNALYTPPSLVCECTVNFGGGAAPPTVTVAGTDDQGALTTTWTGAFVGNNPTAALNQVVSSGAIGAFTRTTVTVPSTAGMVAGQAIQVNAGLVDQETTIVEVVNSGTTFTAVFKVAHGVNAAITGFTAIALAASVGTRRCQTVSGITININGHNAGTVRVCGVQDRMYSPV
jgi:hypothetical protein